MICRYYIFTEYSRWVARGTVARPYSYIPSRFDLVYMNKDGQKGLKSAGKLSRDYVYFL